MISPDARPVRMHPSTIRLVAYIGETTLPTYERMVRFVADKDSAEARNRLSSRLHYLQRRGWIELVEGRWRLASDGWLKLRRAQEEERAVVADRARTREGEETAE